jgi:hypothetical protein
MRGAATAAVLCLASLSALAQQVTLRGTDGREVVVIPARVSSDLQPPEAAPATEAAEMRQNLCGWV